jgi:hypothetical protein
VSRAWRSWLAAGALVLGGCAQREILRNNERVFHAIAAHDVATLAQVLTPDFHYETRDGDKGNRDKFLAGVAANPYTVAWIDNDDLHLTVDGDHAILCGRQRLIVIIDGKRVPDEGRFCDRWERRHGRWLGAFAGVPH